MRRIAFAIFALLGLAVLLGLGTWQVQRLNWKTGILERMEARISTPPGGLPADPTEAHDEYLPVAIAGRTAGQELHVLISTPEFGASYRIVTAFVTDESRRLLVDLGAIPVDAKDAPRPGRDMGVTGNLLWPDEVDGFTPAPETDRNIWFARDLDAMADALDTEALLVVARGEALSSVRPQPITVAGIPNNHLQYAITWFSLAAIWAGMTVLLLWRMATRKK